MSGGHFDYLYCHLNEFADRLEKDIAENNKKDEWGYCKDYSDNTIKKLTEYVYRCRFLANIMKEIEWLYSSDIREDDFLQNCNSIELKFINEVFSKYYASKAVEP